MLSNPTTVAELFRALGLTLTVRAAEDEPDAWACVLAAPDGRVHEISSVTFFDVDPDTGEEWVAEPTPTRTSASVVCRNVVVTPRVTCPPTACIRSRVTRRGCPPFRAVAPCAI